MAPGADQRTPRLKPFRAGKRPHPHTLLARYGLDLRCAVRRSADAAAAAPSLLGSVAAAQISGILVRLETFPAEDGASWLCLDGLGRILVSRIGELVLIGCRMLSPGHILLGCSSADSALIDT